MAKQNGRPRTPAARQRAADLRRQQEAAERRRTLVSRIAMITVLALIAAGIIGYAVWDNRNDEKSRAQDLPGVQSFDDLSRGHTESAGTPVEYEQTPPVGGEHAPPPSWTNCGIYDQPIQNETAVHSLEHGAVWITYRPELPEEDVETLRDTVEDESGGYVILSPYPDLPAPVVASAWGKQLRMTGADDENVAKFIDRYERGPQTPELGAACSGGVGVPISTPG